MSRDKLLELATTFLSSAVLWHIMGMESSRVSCEESFWRAVRELESL